MVLTKHAPGNNRNFKTQVIVSADNSAKEVCGEKFWLLDDYFKAQTTDYNLEKVNYPENSLFYVIKHF